MAERRANTRQRTFLSGRITFNNGNSSEDCLVRELSADGARVELLYPHTPEAFELTIPARAFRAGARVAWRNGARLGVALTPAEPTAAKPPAPKDDLRY